MSSKTVSGNESRHRDRPRARPNYAARWRAFPQDLTRAPDVATEEAKWIYKRQDYCSILPLGQEEDIQNIWSFASKLSYDTSDCRLSRVGNRDRGSAVAGY